MPKSVSTASRLMCALAFGLLSGGSALAAWDFETSKDPMSDEQVGFAAVDNSDSTMGIAFKCWNDGDATQWFAIVTDVDFGDASQYPELEDVTIRADSATPMTVKFAQTNIDNKIAYVTGAELDGAYAALARSLTSANATIAMNFMENIHQFDVSGSGGLLDQMRSVCPRFAE